MTSRKVAAVLVVLSLAWPLSFAQENHAGSLPLSAAEGVNGAQVPSPVRSVLDTLRALGGFDVLVQLFESRGFSAELSRASNRVTVFAPNDNAFADLARRLIRGNVPIDLSNPTSLIQILSTGLRRLEAVPGLPQTDDILRFHLLRTAYTYEQLLSKGSVWTLSNDSLSFGDGEIVDADSSRVATVSSSNIFCLNGWIQVVNRVLVPFDVEKQLDDLEVITAPTATPSTTATPAPTATPTPTATPVPTAMPAPSLSATKTPTPRPSSSLASLSPPDRISPAPNAQETTSEDEIDGENIDGVLPTADPLISATKTPTPRPSAHAPASPASVAASDVISPIPNDEEVSHEEESGGVAASAEPSSEPSEPSEPSVESSSEPGMVAPSDPSIVDVDDSGENTDTEDLTDDNTNDTVSAVSAEGGTCFPAHATVRRADGTSVRMDALQEGDAVHHSESGEASQIFLFTHRKAHGTYTFARISSACGPAVTLTESHYLYANGRLTRAGSVAVGDELRTVHGACAVTRVERVRATGLYAPHSMHGDLVVDGVVVSGYSTAVAPRVAEAILAPVRWAAAAGVRSPLGSALYNGADWALTVLPRGRDQY